MICRDEAQLKKALSLYGPRAVTLLCGDEPTLVAAWRRRVLEALRKDGGDVERFDGRALELTALIEGVTKAIGAEKASGILGALKGILGR